MIKRKRNKKLPSTSTINMRRRLGVKLEDCTVGSTILRRDSDPPGGANILQKKNHKIKTNLILGVPLSISLVTARKRSLGQGNIFTPVCHSVHRGRRCYPSMHCRWYPSMPCRGGLLPGAACCLTGCLVEQPPPTGRLLLRAVRTYWNAFWLSSINSLLSFPNEP